MSQKRDEFVATALDAWKEAETALETNGGVIDDLVGFKMEKAQFYATLATVPSNTATDTVSRLRLDDEDDRP